METGAKSSIHLYTDGAAFTCGPHADKSAWAAIIVGHDGKRTDLCGVLDACTSHQDAEIAAVMEGFRALPTGARVTLVSDNKMICDAVELMVEGNVSRPAQVPCERTWNRLVDALQGFHITVERHYKKVPSLDAPLQPVAHALAQQTAKLGRAPEHSFCATTLARREAPAGWELT